MSEYGIEKIERIYKNKIAPKTIQILTKVYGVKTDIYRVKNKRIQNQVRTEVQSNNKFSNEIYQTSSLLASNDNLSIIDDNEKDYLNSLDKIHTTYVLITSLTFEQFSGFISGSSEDFNVYCLDFDLHQNDILEYSTKEGIKSRLKIKEIESIGKNVVILKKYVCTSLLF